MDDVISVTVSAYVDGYELPSKVRGWGYWGVNGEMQPGLTFEAVRGGVVISRVRASDIRPDISGDQDFKAGFELDLGLETLEALLSGAIQLRTVTPGGVERDLPIWEPTREAMRSEIAASLLPPPPGMPADDDQAAHAFETAMRILALRAAKARPKIVFLGAGSTGFAKSLLGDLMLRPSLAAARIALYDIDGGRLQTADTVARRMAQQLGSQAEITTTLDLQAALAGASYVVNLIQVGGHERATAVDFEIPSRFGLRQTLGDTMGIGGIMRALRTVPVLLDITREMERLCPNAVLLNYANPMAINGWALSRASSIRTIGLCHSVPHTAAELARDLGLEPASLRYLAAGINHMAFYLRLEAEGQDLYPRVRALQAERGRGSGHAVRYDMLKRLGYLVAEPSEQFAECVPWYIKRDRPDLLEIFGIPLDEYPRRHRSQSADWQHLAEAARTSGLPLDIRPSVEYGADLIHAIETGEPAVVYCNVPNKGLIGNLPEGCCVEVPCLVDGNGVQPVPVGNLPPQLAALMLTNIAPQGLAVEAALTGRREHVYQAAMLDPHTAAELSLDEIWRMVDELILAHGALIPAMR